MGRRGKSGRDLGPTREGTFGTGGAHVASSTRLVYNGLVLQRIISALSPSAKAVLLAFACLLYVLSPIDAIPDFTPFFGFADDLAAVVLTVMFLWRTLRPGAVPGKGSAGGSIPEEGSAPGVPEPDPCETLGLRPGADPASIRKAYREMMAQYHPDKVAHLGEELKRTALRKTLEIKKAYERLGSP